MKSLALALQANPDEGTTTQFWCWRISRTDFEPESGFAASHIWFGSDLSLDPQDAEGVLSLDRTTQTDNTMGAGMRLKSNFGG